MTGKINGAPGPLLLALALAMLTLTPACQKHTVHDEQMISPAGNMSRMKGDDMPPNQTIPVPPSWHHGFKAPGT